MRPIFFIPLLCGLCAVLQAGINRIISARNGLSWAIVVNNFTIVILGLILFQLARALPHHFPELLRPTAKLTPFYWWYLIPGFCGLCLVAGIPYAITHIGSFNAFMLLVAGQIIGTLTWDVWVENISLNLMRPLGALLVFVGVILANWKK